MGRLGKAAVTMGLALVAGAVMGTAGPARAGLAPDALRHPVVSVAAPATALHPAQSNNWSGYNQGALSGKLFQGVGAEWTVPKATAHTAKQNEYSATWVGIGGGCVDTGCYATDATLIQAGTEQDVDSSGHASYSAWWEVIPAPSAVATTVTVHPGDTIKCTIAQTVPEVWTISLTDLTDHQGFVQRIPYSSDFSTAEWITEAPVVVGSGSVDVTAPLPALGAVHFDLATVNGAPAQLASSQEIQMVDSQGKVIADPSAPDADRDGFSDCTWASTCSAPAS